MDVDAEQVERHDVAAAQDAEARVARDEAPEPAGVAEEYGASPEEEYGEVAAQDVEAEPDVAVFGIQLLVAVAPA